MTIDAEDIIVKIKTRGVATLAAVGALVSGVTAGATPASAVVAKSWTQTLQHKSIVVDNSTTRTNFAYTAWSSTNPRPYDGVITNVSYRISRFGNGNISDTVTLCYLSYPQLVESNCKAVATTGTATVSTTSFNGLNPQGAIVVRHTISGGTIPYYPPTTETDTIKMDYQV